MSWPSRIEGTLNALEVVVGQGVVVEPGVLITGNGGPARRIVLGDFCYIGHNVRIFAPEFRLGDYSKLHMHTFGHGELPLQIGRNCWIGGHCVLDSMAGLTIDDGVGIGAQSQLWTHMQFGDIVEGCRFHSRSPMHVAKDAWLVGHCIVSPVRIGERAMALAGSVVTRDMQPNHVYGGTPAVDLTGKLGPQFAERSVHDKAAKLRELIDAFEAEHPQHAGQLHVSTAPSTGAGQVGTLFDVSTRTYTRTRAPAEVAFLRKHVPLIKFTPAGAPAFIDGQPPQD